MKMRLIGLSGRKNNRGYTLLEYCAGAAVIAGVVYAALLGLGQSMEGFLTGLGNWVESRTPTAGSGGNP